MVNTKLDKKKIKILLMRFIHQFSSIEKFQDCLIILLHIFLGCLCILFDFTGQLWFSRPFSSTNGNNLTSFKPCHALTNDIFHCSGSLYHAP